MSFVQNHKTKKRKTQFAFCYLHVDLKRDAFPTYPSYPLPTSLTLAQPQTGGLCMLRNIDLDAARCIGMRHSDTATTPSIKPKWDSRGDVDFRFSTEEHNETDRGSPMFAHRNVTQYYPNPPPMRSSCHHHSHSHPHPLRSWRHACRGF